MKRNEVFVGKYLKADDLPDEGMPVTIDHVVVEEVGGAEKKESKPVIYFQETEKGLVCNLTNWKSIEKVTGEGDTDNWTGHLITLYATEVEFKGDTVMSIRVRLKAPKTSATAA